MPLKTTNKQINNCSKGWIFSTNPKSINGISIFSQFEFVFSQLGKPSPTSIGSLLFLNAYVNGQTQKLVNSSYGRANVGRPGRTYIQQLCEDTGCSPEDLPEAMYDWEKWQERVRHDDDDIYIYIFKFFEDPN